MRNDLDGANFAWTSALPNIFYGAIAGVMMVVLVCMMGVAA